VGVSSPRKRDGIDVAGILEFAGRRILGVAGNAGPGIALLGVPAHGARRATQVAGGSDNLGVVRAQRILQPAFR
jgi:hypothetical protein